MAGPIVMIGFHAVKKDKLEVAKHASEELVSFIEDNHPRFLHFAIGFSEEGDEMRVLQVHQDEESMIRHMELARERIAAAYGFLEGTKAIHVFGDPSEAFTERMLQMAMGAPVTTTRADSGFSRLTNASV